KSYPVPRSYGQHVAYRTGYVECSGHSRSRQHRVAHSAVELGGEVHVHIDQAGHDQFSVDVDDPCRGSCYLFGHLSDDPITDADVVPTVDPIGGVVKMATSKYDFVARQHC